MTYVLSLQNIGLSGCGTDEFLGGDVKENPLIFPEKLNGGENCKGNAFLAHASFALVASGIAATPGEGFDVARWLLGARS